MEYDKSPFSKNNSGFSGEISGYIQLIQEGVAPACPIVYSPRRERSRKKRDCWPSLLLFEAVDTLAK